MILKLDIRYNLNLNKYEFKIISKYEKMEDSSLTREDFDDKYQLPIIYQEDIFDMTGKKSGIMFIDLGQKFNEKSLSFDPLISRFLESDLYYYYLCSIERERKIEEILD